MTAGRKLTILIAESAGFPPEAASLLGGFGDPVFADLNRDELLSAIREADVLWVRLRHRIDAEVINAARRLKIIVSPTTGLNHIDLEETSRRGIRVLSLRGEAEFLSDVRATAEHTIGLMLLLLRRTFPAIADVRQGNWDRDRFQGRELYGKTIGIIGYGRLGRIVARYLKAFDAQILINDPHVEPEKLGSGLVIVSLCELLSRSDIVTLHVSLSDETHGFFGKEQFAAMKAGSWFVNTARGELVDETALLEALQSGQLAGAALDVLCGEQQNAIGSHPLITNAAKHDNLLITPHLGGCTIESMEKTELFMARKLRDSCSYSAER